MTTEGDEIRRRRERLAMTQEQFAQHIGTTQPTIARWEAGAISIRHPSMLLKALDMALQNPTNAIENWDFSRINRATGFAEIPPFQRQDEWRAYFTVENITRHRGRCVFTQEELDVMAKKAIENGWNGGPNRER